MSGEFVFISYSRDASVRAHQISGYLEPLEVETFLFEKNLAKVRNPAKRVVAAIRRSDAIILVLSARSRESAWVSNELGIAIGANVRVLVYKIAHNLKLPDYLDVDEVTVLSRLEELDDFFP